VDFPLEARNIFTGTHGEVCSKIYLKKKSIATVRKKKKKNVASPEPREKIDSAMLTE